MSELKFTKADMISLINERKSFTGTDEDFLHMHCDPIVEFPMATEDVWYKNMNVNSKFDDSCSHCGRGANGAVMFHQVCGGGMMGSKKDAPLFSLYDDGDMYLYCVGTTCAKKVIEPILKKQGLNPKNYLYGAKYKTKYETTEEYKEIQCFESVEDYFKEGK